MQSFAQNRLVNRVVIFVSIVALIIFASWSMASTQGLSSRLEEVYSYLAYSSSRTPASTDNRIQTMQERLRAYPKDWQAYSQLSLPHLQKARETGDPTYYQKTEEAL